MGLDPQVARHNLSGTDTSNVEPRRVEQACHKHVLISYVLLKFVECPRVEPCTSQLVPRLRFLKFLLVNMFGNHWRLRGLQCCPVS